MTSFSLLVLLVCCRFFVCSYYGVYVYIVAMFTCFKLLTGINHVLNDSYFYSIDAIFVFFIASSFVTFMLCLYCFL